MPAAASQRLTTNRETVSDPTDSLRVVRRTEVAGAIVSVRRRLGPLRRRLFPRPHPRAALLTALPPGSVGAEIGVWKGNLSAILLEQLRPKRLHLIDPWQYQPSDEYFDWVYLGRGPQLRPGPSRPGPLLQQAAVRRPPLRRRLHQGRVVGRLCDRRCRGARGPVGRRSPSAT